MAGGNLSPSWGTEDKVTYDTPVIIVMRIMSFRNKLFGRDCFCCSFGLGIGNSFPVLMLGSLRLSLREHRYAGKWYPHPHPASWARLAKLMSHKYSSCTVILMMIMM